MLQKPVALKPVAILSSTVMPADGIYRVTRVEGAEREAVLASLAGVSHYIGHPATRAIAEDLGADKAESNLFAGLREPGWYAADGEKHEFSREGDTWVQETAVALPIKQGRSTRAKEGFTVHQEVTLDDLDVVVMERLLPVCTCCWNNI